MDSMYSLYQTIEPYVTTKRLLLLSIPTTILAFLCLPFKTFIVALFIVPLIILIFILLHMSSTNKSVEFTVGLAKFFPPADAATFDTSQFPWAKLMRDHHEEIHQEFLAFEKKFRCPELDEVYPNGSITNWDRKWPTATLRCYGVDTELTKLFPTTTRLINTCGVFMSHVMVSVIQPGKFIPRHRGPYRGVFRYQLSLEIPPHKPDELYLVVWPGTSSHEFWDPDDTPASVPKVLRWQKGSDFMFDDTCVHEVNNRTSFRRIILFVDVERHDLTLLQRIFHRIFMKVARFLPAVRAAVDTQNQIVHKGITPSTKENKEKSVSSDSACGSELLPSSTTQTTSV